MVESAHASSIFVFEYYARGTTAGKGFEDRFSYDSILVTINLEPIPKLFPYIQ
jgi:hypothetical protein